MILKILLIKDVEIWRLKTTLLWQELEDKLIVGGYDTDDLTYRQNYVFRKLYNNPMVKNNLLALNFLSYSVRKNFQYREFYNYEDDCDYLLKIRKETLIKYGIDLKELYT